MNNQCHCFHLNVYATTAWIFKKNLFIFVVLRESQLALNLLLKSGWPLLGGGGAKL